METFAWVFEVQQADDGDASVALGAIRSFLNPVSFVKDPNRFRTALNDVNGVLRFAGIEYLDNGEFQTLLKAHSLSDATARSNAIREKFSARDIHPEVWRYCTAELMADNYFHAVLEAAKGLSYRIREMSGVDGDGAKLVDRVFMGEDPILKFNPFETETHRSEHRGFAALLKGCFAAIRNPIAHEPRIHWEGEENAADFLSLISLLHRKLDDCKLDTERVLDG
ncbi:MAG: TIGR02391 family protein [Chloroflexota bacterium]|nr:TIGR02391 family protein [Chloroflexota bacterium]